MASYSTNLALTLLDTGEGAGTWGNTTNTNLGTLLEQAISGYATESLTAGTTLTLTIPNGSTGVARNMYLEFTGNGSTVIVPSNKKLYFVYNNCSSGTITVKVAGQTGVTIPKGEKQILVSNGTDVAIAAGTNISGFTTSDNTGFGVNAGDSITSGVNNTAVGYNAGTALTSGTENTLVGDTAGDAVTTANWNTAIGSNCGGNLTSGGANSFVGYSAGNGVSTGTTNSALGDSSYPSGNYSNSTCLGYNSSVDGSNQVQAGNSLTTLYYYAATQRASDSRDKADIQDTTFGLDFIMKLRPRMYRWDMRDDYRTKPPAKPSLSDYPDDTAYEAAVAQWRQDYSAWEEANKLSNITHDGTHKRNRLHQGLIAQELKQVMDEMGVDFAGYQDFKIDGGDDRLTVVYNELITPMIKAIQELKAEFDEYKRTHP